MGVSCQCPNHQTNELSFRHKQSSPRLKDQKQIGKDDLNDIGQPKQTNTNNDETTCNLHKKEFDLRDQIQLEKLSIDSLLKKAQKKHSEKNYLLSERMYLQALKKLQIQQQKSIQRYEKISLCNLNLINLILLTNQKKDIQKYAKSALQIYDSNEGIYYEQKIVLLNSISLHLQKNGKLKDAIQAQRQILNLQEMYYPKNDERKWLTSNNIACYYYENGQQKQGNLQFTKLLKKTQRNYQMNSAIRANHQFYLKKEIKLPNS